jgi:Rod binding domain-containing protein
MSALSPVTLSAPQAGATQARPSHELAGAARDFEALFLRQLLQRMEKAFDSQSSGGSIYGPMMVGALADTVAGAGGIGLSEVITRALMQHESSAAETQHPTHTRSSAGPEVQDSGLAEGSVGAKLPSVP